MFLPTFFNSTWALVGLNIVFETQNNLYFTFPSLIMSNHHIWKLLYKLIYIGLEEFTTF